MKRISVKLVGSATPPFTIHVNQGDTAGEVLSRLNLAGVVLAIPPAPNRYFAPDEPVYEELLEGDYLLAVAPPAPSAAPLEEIADTAAPAYKRLKIRIIGSKRPPVPVQIRPGTTATQVLASLKLSHNYVLVPAVAEVADIPSTIFNERFAPEDDVYEKTRDGDTLIAIHGFAAGRVAFAVMMQKHTPKEIRI
jgi:hypothetical protein